MTKGGRIFAGIVALIGSGILIIAAFTAWLFGLGGAVTQLTVVVTIIVAALAFISSILTLTDKTGGCVLLLLIGIYIVVASILPYFGIVFADLPVFSFWIDGILVLLGGIIGLAVGSE